VRHVVNRQTELLLLVEDGGDDIGGDGVGNDVRMSDLDASDVICMFPPWWLRVSFGFPAFVES